MFTPASASFRPNLAQLKVDAALGAHIAKMCELAWLALEFDTEEVHHNSPPRGYPTLRNLRPWPVRRKPLRPTAPTVATTLSWISCRTSREPAMRALASSGDEPEPRANSAGPVGRPLTVWIASDTSPWLPLVLNRRAGPRRDLDALAAVVTLLAERLDSTHIWVLPWPTGATKHQAIRR